MQIIGFVVLSLLSSMVMASNVVDCEKAMTTIEINQCAKLELESAQDTLNQYYQASLKRHQEDKELVSAIETSQADWQTYMESQCGAVFTQWRDGTIRGVVTLSCKTTLTKQRTHQLWQYFLTYMDSTPPILPEPEL